MRYRGLLFISVCLLPAMASARDVDLCADLFGKLNNAPVMIGKSAQMRESVQALAQKNIEIRKMRIDMRNSGCGGGSIVVLGSSNNGMCEGMRQELQSLETERETIAAERNNSRQLAYSSEERTAILAAIRANACLPSDYEEKRKADEMERVRIRGLALPKDDEQRPAQRPGDTRSASLKQDDPQSSVTHLNTLSSGPSQVLAANPPLDPRERPYDPGQKVRMVGPVFLPDENIDLAHPKAPGSQPQQ
jgi:hypothetical protein